MSPELRNGLLITVGVALMLFCALWMLSHGARRSPPPPPVSTQVSTPSSTVPAFTHVPPPARPVAPVRCRVPRVCIPGAGFPR